MGTALISTLLEIHGFHFPARVFLAIAATVAITIALGWLVFRSPRFEPGVMPAWGMVSMGTLSLGSATTAILGDSWWWFHITCWVMGGTLGLVTCVVYIRLIFTRGAGAPTFSWGLPLVAPMVASTTGMHVHNRFMSMDAPAGCTTIIFYLCVGSFLLSLLLAPAVFARVYFYYFSPAGRRSTANQLPPMAAPTTWIPLGVVGQSTAAAQLLGAASGWKSAALIYGTVLFVLAIPIVATALRFHYHVAIRGISYSPTWWASTFPVGTFCLGTHALYLATGIHWLDSISLFLLGLMLVHVVIATLGGTIAIVKKVATKLLDDSTTPA